MLNNCTIVITTEWNPNACYCCPLQPSSSVEPGCQCPVLVSTQLACPISSQVTDHWGELRNRTGEVHHVDPCHSLDNLKNHFASIAFCMNSVSLQCPERSCDRVVLCRLDKRVFSSLLGGGRLLSTLLSFMLSFAVLTNEV